MTPEQKSRVYITVDTETSLGGAWRNPGYAPLPLERSVFGRCGALQYGIPLIMDILEDHGFRATFFTEMFCSHVLPAGAVADVCEYVDRRGHDLQLHLHPIYRFYRDARAGGPRREIDLLHRLPPAEQEDLIGEGVALFRAFSGKRPRAFRAGCYGASETTLSMLRAHGVEIDSSYNLAYLDRTCGFRTRPLNAPAEIAGVYEFPVTNFSAAPLEPYKPLEISAVSAGETLRTIRALRQAGCYDVVLVLHSFSLLKNRGVRFENCRPDRIVIARLRRLCAELARMRGEAEVCVLGEAAAPACAPVTAVPRIGAFRPAIRKLVQAVDYIPWV